MIKNALIFLLLFFILKHAQAQNWEPVPCFDGNEQIYNIFIDSLHDKIILNFFGDYNVCNTNFKGLLSYDGNTFSSLDFGIESHDILSKTPGGRRALGCVPYQGKTLFGGFFSTVGSNALPSEALALWNGFKWDSFPKYAFKYNPYLSANPTPQIVNGFYKDGEKLWIYGQFDSIGKVPGKNLYTFDGNSFQYINIPTSYNNLVNKIYKFKDELYIAGSFYNFPYDSLTKIIRFKNGIWKNVSTGIIAPLGGVADMIAYKDTLYIAGEFSKAQGNAGNHLVKWDGAKFHDAGFGDFYDWGGVRQLVVFKNRLYAFGRFKYAANKKAFGAAYYENGRWIVNTDSLDNVIMNALVYKNSIYASGGFSSINGDNNLRYFVRLKCPDFDGCMNSYNQPPVKLTIYPNPSADNFQINFGEDYSSCISILVFNALGELIYTESPPESQLKINTTGWPDGIYFLKYKNNKDVITYKLIKTSFKE